MTNEDKLDQKLDRIEQKLTEVEVIFERMMIALESIELEDEE